MTVIAWDGRVLACDGMVTDHSEVHIDLIDYQKIVAYPGKKGARGVLAAGFAGDVNEGQAMLRWVGTGCSSKAAPELYGDRSELLAVDDKGMVWYMDENGSFEEYKTGAFAIGSGKAYAMAAMESGVDAIEAVRVTARFSPSVGGIGTAWNFDTRTMIRFPCSIILLDDKAYLSS